MEAGYKQITHGTYNMHKIINITLKAIAAMLMLAAAASCVFEKDNPSGTDQQKYKYVLVQLGVNTDRMTPTKADGDVTGADDEAGSPAETAINDLRVYAYTKDGENGAMVLRGYFHAQDVDAAATATKPLLMDIKVPFEEYGDTKQVYFMAVANAGGMTGTDGIIINSIGRDPQTGALVLPDSFGFGEFAGIRYSVADQTFAKGMPMYCQTSAAVEVNLGAAGTTSTEPGHNGHTKLPVKVTLDLTRSLSKIEVYAAEDAGAGTSGTSTAGIQITGVELMNVIADGPLFPAAASTTKLTTNPTLAGKAVALSASAADKADPSKYTKITDAYYLAENAAGTTGKFYYGDDLSAIATTDNLKAATTLKIGYKVGTNGDQKYGYVIMPPIERNTWYKVLARITAGGQMTLTFVAQPWNLVTEELTYDDNVSVTEGKIKWSVEPNDNAEVVTTGNDLSCEFTIATPSYATWHASFIPLEGDQNAFGFVTTDDNLNVVTVPTFSGPVGSPAKLTIRPLVQNPTQTNKARLRIIVRTDEGRTIVVKNSILSGNNEYSNDEYILIHSM